MKKNKGPYCPTLQQIDKMDEIESDGYKQDERLSKIHSIPVFKKENRMWVFGMNGSIENKPIIRTIKS